MAHTDWIKHCTTTKAEGPKPRDVRGRHSATVSRTIGKDLVCPRRMPSLGKTEKEN